MLIQGISQPWDVIREATLITSHHHLNTPTSTLYAEASRVLKNAGVRLTKRIPKRHQESLTTSQIRTIQRLITKHYPERPLSKKGVSA
jgi:hypothetical protein